MRSLKKAKKKKQNESRQGESQKNIGIAGITH